MKRIVKSFLYSLVVVSLLSIASISFASKIISEENISGRIITGFRVLDVDDSAKIVNYTVYRGDYIKFSYPPLLGTLDFSMPELKYKAKVIPNLKKAKYFKMKLPGMYEFKLGNISGIIKVVELVRPNYMELSANQAVEILENLKPFILDVRTPMEYQKIHITGSVLIPIQQLQSRVGELDAQKNADVFIYCATGNRSTVASRILANRGFKRIYNLRYGVYDWARRGNPVVLK